MKTWCPSCKFMRDRGECEHVMGLVHVPDYYDQLRAVLAEDEHRRSPLLTHRDQPQPIERGPQTVTIQARATAALLPPMSGRLDGRRSWESRFFVEPSFEAVTASWRAREEWTVDLKGRPRSWGIQAVVGDGLYEWWAHAWDAWGRELKERIINQSGDWMRDVSCFTLMKPAPNRTWLVGCDLW
jgi:hypothetical protein